MKRLMLLLPMLLSGCAIYAPRAPLPAKVFSAPYLADLSNPALFTSYDAMPDGAAKVARRNQLLYEYLWLTDNRYDSYERRFFTGQAYVSTGGDVLNIALTGVAAVTGSAPLKAVLAVIAAGMTGVEASYSKNFVDQQSRELIVQKMRQGRLTALAPIESGMASSTYTLEQGFLDVSAYYAAGTVTGALLALQEATGQQAVAAKEALRTIRK